MRTIAVIDPADPSLESFRHVRDGAWIKSRGLFLAEGHAVLARLLDSPRFALESVLISARRVEGLSPLLERVPVEIPIYVAPDPVLEAIVGFDLHRGVLATGRVGAPLGAAELVARLPEGPWVLLALEGLSDNDNVGACFRNAAAFSAAGLLLDAQCADPLYRKSIRVSLGHVLRVPFARTGPFSETLPWLAQQGVVPIALTPRASATPLGDLALGRRPLPPRIALVLGTEGEGLSESALAACPEKWRITMAPGVDSLNVATAAAIALHVISIARTSTE